jgi:hypothetical protein
MILEFEKLIKKGIIRFLAYKGLLPILSIRVSTAVVAMLLYGILILHKEANL